MNNIEHEATISQITDKTVWAKISARSACESCGAKGSCSMAECRDKIIEIQTSEAANHKVGDKITVILAQNSGFVAVGFGYVLPLILTLATLLVVLLISKSEIYAGISAILILIPYYFGLFLSRNYIKKKFSFRIKSQ